jgi:hypothetical protein
MDFYSDYLVEIETFHLQNSEFVGLLFADSVFRWDPPDTYQTFM